MRATLRRLSSNWVLPTVAAASVLAACSGGGTPPPDDGVAPADVVPGDEASTDVQPLDVRVPIDVPGGDAHAPDVAVDVVASDGAPRDGAGVDAAPGDASALDAASSDVPVMDASVTDVVTVDVAAMDASGVDTGSTDVATVTDSASGDASVGASFDLLDLGHVNPVYQVFRDGSRGLSIDNAGHWVLWDLGAHSQVAAGETHCDARASGCSLPLAGLRGPLLMLYTGTGFELRSSVTGALTGTVTYAPTRFGIASDGSYVWAANTTTIQAWSAAGAMLRSVAGNYGSSDSFGAAGELRVALGPAGAGVIEAIPISGGAATLSAPFSDPFVTWSVDGARFITSRVLTSGALVRVYSSAGALVSSGTLPSSVGIGTWGNWLWTTRATTLARDLEVYPLADLSAAAGVYPLVTNTQVVPGDGTLGIVPFGAHDLQLVQLGMTLTSRTVTLNVEYMRAFAADAGGYMVGAANGPVLEATGAATPATLAFGKIDSISGNTSGLAAVATDVGQVLMVRVGAPPSVLQLLPYRSSHVEVPTDGTRVVIGPYLEAAQYRDDRSVQLIDLATGMPSHVWRYFFSAAPRLVDFTAARDSLVMAHATGAPGSVTRVLTNPDGTTFADYGPTAQATTTALHLIQHFSPSGARAAMTDGAGTAALTRLYQSGVASGLVDGYDLGWLDEGRVLIMHYTSGSAAQTGIYSPTGALIAMTSLPTLTPMSAGDLGGRGTVVPLGREQIYSPGDNAIYDIASGATLWTGSYRGLSGVAGDYVIHPTGTRLVVERFR